jgi:hypothetical protein
VRLRPIVRETGRSEMVRSELFDRRTILEFRHGLEKWTNHAADRAVAVPVFRSSNLLLQSALLLTVIVKVNPLNPVRGTRSTRHGFEHSDLKSAVKRVPILVRKAAGVCRGVERLNQQREPVLYFRHASPFLASLFSAFADSLWERKPVMPKNAGACDTVLLPRIVNNRGAG